jgi:hypothetical protein
LDSLSRFDWIDNNSTGNAQSIGSSVGSPIGVANIGQSANTSPLSSQLGKRALLSMHWNYLDRSGFEWFNRVGYKRVLENIDDAVYAASFSSGVSNTSVGVSVGIKPIENTMVLIGYNFRGVRDTDFFGSNQHAKGFVVSLRMLFDEKLLGLSRPIASAFS